MYRIDGFGRNVFIILKRAKALSKSRRVRKFFLAALWSTTHQNARRDAAQLIVHFEENAVFAFITVYISSAFAFALRSVVGRANASKWSQFPIQHKASSNSIFSALRETSVKYARRLLVGAIYDFAILEQISHASVLQLQIATKATGFSCLDMGQKILTSNSTKCMIRAWTWHPIWNEKQSLRKVLTWCGQSTSLRCSSCRGVSFTANPHHEFSIIFRFWNTFCTMKSCKFLPDWSILAGQTGLAQEVSERRTVQKCVVRTSRAYRRDVLLFDLLQPRSGGPAEGWVRARCAAVRGVVGVLPMVCFSNNPAVLAWISFLHFSNDRRRIYYIDISSFHNYSCSSKFFE